MRLLRLRVAGVLLVAVVGVVGGCSGPVEDAQVSQSPQGAEPQSPEAGRADEPADELAGVEPVSSPQWWDGVCPGLLGAQEVLLSTVEPSSEAWGDRYTVGVAAGYYGEFARAFDMAAEAIRAAPPVDLEIMNTDLEQRVARLEGVADAARAQQAAMREVRSPEDGRILWGEWQDVLRPLNGEYEAAMESAVVAHQDRLGDDEAYQWALGEFFAAVQEGPCGEAWQDFG